GGAFHPLGQPIIARFQPALKLGKEIGISRIQLERPAKREKRDVVLQRFGRGMSIWRKWGRHLADFAGIGDGPDINLTVDDETGAPAVADEEIDEIVQSRGDAVGLFADRGCSSVVLQAGGKPRRLLKHVRQRKTLPVAHDPGIGLIGADIEWPGHGHAQAQQFLRRFWIDPGKLFPQIFNQLKQYRHAGLRSARRQMVQTADKGLAGKVDRYSQDLVAIELHSDRVGSPGEDSIWRRRLSARAADRLLRHSQAVALELLNDIADS